MNTRLIAATGALALLSACQQEEGVKESESTRLGNLVPEMALTDGAPRKPVDEAKPGGITSGCDTADAEIFSCQLENGRRVAVCLASTGEGRHAQYRYGAVGKAAELVLPVAGEKGEPARYANVMYSGGGEQQIVFTSGDYRYTVFSRVVRTNFTPGETNDPAISDGLMVQRGDKRIAFHSCEYTDDLKPVDLDRAKSVMTAEPELLADVPFTH